MSRILVVEDNTDIRNLIRSLLAPLNAELVEAIDGQGALELLAKGEWQVVVTDFDMPRLNGLELYHRICQSRPELRGRFIFVTGTASGELAGVDCPVLTKPIEFDALVQEVKNQLAQVAS
ncbi:MAG: hypothetical protein AMXMBFR7_13970 [Planctomycetota bacterium]